jgi:integrase
MPKLTDELTDKVMRGLPVPEKGNVLWYDPDLKGFAGRVTYKGARAFVGVYHFGGVERRDVVGGFPEWKAKAAREVFKSWKREVDLGIDPRGEPSPDNPEDATFKARAQQYLADPRKKRQKTPLRASTKREYTRALLTYAKPLHGRPFDAISRREVSDLLDKVKTERGTVSAARARAAMGRLYSWGMAKGYCEHSPVVGTESWESPKRERELSDAELQMVWNATAELEAYNTIVRTLAGTGARPAEVGGMAVEEFGDDGTWEFTAERAKNGRPLALPLSRQTQTAIAAWRNKHPGSDPVFGRKEGKPFSGWSAAKRRLDATIARMNAERRLGRKLAKGEQPAPQDYMKSWQLRDLRRTVETRLASIGIPQEIINRTLNHAQGPITSTYNRYEYIAEKRDALQRWADRLEEIVTPPAPPAADDQPAASNVVRLAARR